MPPLASFGKKLGVGKSKELTAVKLGMPDSDKPKLVIPRRDVVRSGILAGVVFLAGSTGLGALASTGAEAADGAPPTTRTPMATLTPLRTSTPRPPTTPTRPPSPSRTPTAEATTAAPTMAEVQRRLGMTNGEVYQADCTNGSGSECVAAVASGATTPKGQTVAMWIGIAGNTLNQWGLKLGKPTLSGQSIVYQIEQMYSLPRMGFKPGSQAIATASLDGTVDIKLHFIASGGQEYNYKLNYDPASDSYGSTSSLLSAVQTMAEETGVSLTQNGKDKYFGK